MAQADSHDTTTNVVKFPYSVSRHVHARRSRRSKNGRTPEERAAKVALTRAKAVARKNLDPAFTLIAEKLVADVAHCEAIDAQAEAEKHGIGTDAMGPVIDRIMSLPATTIEGLAAKADILRHTYEKGFNDEFANHSWDDAGTVRAGRSG
jgi:hypothetical protein